MDSAHDAKRRDELARFSYEYALKCWERWQAHRDMARSIEELHEQYRRDARQAGFVEFSDDELSNDFGASLMAAR